MGTKKYVGVATEMQLPFCCKKREHQMAKSCRIKSLHKTLRRLLMLYHDCIEKLLQLKIKDMK